MNKLITCSALCISLTVLSAPPSPPSPTPAPSSAAVPVPNATGPKIQFATNIYDYGRQISGTMVNYTFVFTNTGDQVLEVPTAQGSCHCTTAGDWNKRVEPGKTGTIPVTFNSTGFSGQLTRTVTLTCNDKTQPTVVLQMTGTIWKPIDVSPGMAYFNIPPDSASPVSNVVHIVSNMEEPLELFPPESNQPRFTAMLTTNEPGKKFELTVVALPPFSQGSVQGQITLKTTSSNNPVITVAAMANVPPAVTVMPAVINLPFVPLDAPATNVLTIRNVSTNVMTLTDPAINAKDVDVRLSEQQSGHAYTVTLVFPRGFQPAVGSPVEFTVKSSHPQYPVIRAPLYAMPRPTAGK